jgi:uncharacterized protein DUF6152
MKYRAVGVLTSVLAAFLLAATPGAHHEILAKFDDTKPTTLNGVVTEVDWANPHVHIFMNVRTGNQNINWAVETASPIDLVRSGWNEESIQPGDALTVTGITARNGSRQAWAKSIVMTKTGKAVLMVKSGVPAAPLSPRPTPKWPDGQIRLGSLPGSDGYWGYPTSTVMTDNNVKIDMDEYGLLKNIADASKVAPMQPWALALYVNRQRRFLQDDPMFLNCKPPGGPRQFQSEYGLQFVEDRDRQRMFVLLGSGNRNYRIVYLDGRGHVGQQGGDDDNPLYYGRSVAKWEGGTLVADTRGFNEDFWFTNGGLPHTEQLKLLERFTRTDLDTLKYEVTVDDPGAYTRPWSASWNLRWVASEELPVHICQDNRP